MKSVIAFSLGLSLLLIPFVQTESVQAAEPTELNLTIDDLLGTWTGTLEILLDQDTGHFAALKDRSSGPYDVEIRLTNKYMTDPESDLRIGYSVYSPYTIESVYLEKDGSVYGLSTSSPSRSLEFLGAFEVEGTRIKLSGTIQEKQWDVPGAGPDEGTRTLRLIAYKEGALVTAPPATAAESVELGTGAEKGRITLARGEVYIERFGRLIDAATGEGLMAGDTLIIGEDSEMTIETESGGRLKLIEKMRFTLPKEEEKVKIDTNSLRAKIENIWIKTKEFLAGQSFKVSNATAGVRG